RFTHDSSVPAGGLAEQALYLCTRNQINQEKPRFMKLEMKVPSPGESISEVEIASWLVKDGDYVEKDQAIAEIDSDKATLELPAEESGTITLKAEEGDTVAVGDVVCIIDTDAEKPAGEKAPAKKAEPETKAAEPAKASEEKKSEVKAEKPAEETSNAKGHPSPAARKLMDENNVSC